MSYVRQIVVEEFVTALGKNYVFCLGRHKETNAALVADNAVAHHLGISAHNGVLVDTDFSRQFAHRIEFVARHQFALQNAVGYAVGNLLKYAFLLFKFRLRV